MDARTLSLCGVPMRRYEIAVDKVLPRDFPTTFIANTDRYFRVSSSFPRKRESSQHLREATHSELDPRLRGDDEQTIDLVHAFVGKPQGAS
jgi:hypothetical protein